jgi:exodeoxyribonuclease V alpha subunit
MTTHISARMAWHDSGWNGTVCRHPKANTYCVGHFSFPGDMIAERRDLSNEIPAAGRAAHDVGFILPCMANVNAFGSKSISGQMPPPSWFNDGTEDKTWQIPAYTIATWPYEEVYRDDVRNPEGIRPRYNPIKRREAVKEFFSQITPGKSLIFYYSNYSNPFSENDQLRYVLVGVGRVKQVGEELKWTNQSEKMEEKYGPNVWLRNITSNYPDEGLRIPYHAYLDRPEILERILFVPDNPRAFKYASRHITDDGALALIERFAEIVGTLIEIDDTHENWQVRLNWLNSLMAELWQSRGLYPGLARVMNYLAFQEAVQFCFHHQAGDEEQARHQLFDLVQEKTNAIDGLEITPQRLKSVRKKWGLLETEQQILLSDVLPRLDIQVEQISNILDNPLDVSLISTFQEIYENPYILSEQYIGLNPDDQITFNQIDHAMLPSPELGQPALLEVDGWQRLRALCVEQLEKQSQHTFMSSEVIIGGINRRLSYIPEWKRTEFKTRHLEVEKEELSGALQYRYEDKQLYLYLMSVFEDERMIEMILRRLAALPNINLRFPMTEDNWRNFLFDSDSELAKSHPDEYRNSIAQQFQVCQGIFRRPLSVLCGSAGTGKTTVVKAMIQAIEKAHGQGTSFQLLAPTGKAADRLRERTGKPAKTIHSFLAERGWLNENFTFKPFGGRQEDGISTYIIDESSMLDLPLLATLFRSINWISVQRLIFVGDPNQLPPIGRGRVFADLIDWLRREQPEHIGELTTNMRQIRNRLEGQGTGIIDLASIFMKRDSQNLRTADEEITEEEMLGKVQEGGEISGDLRVLYWQTTEELEKLLVSTIIEDMEKASGQKLDAEKPYELWNMIMKSNGKDRPEALQIVSPYRGELFGTENVNRVIQRQKGGRLLDTKGELGGITYFDKVIQMINRPKSNPVWAYNIETRKNERLEVYNGEIGIVKIHGFDTSKWKWSGFHIEKFQVAFSRKEKLWVNYDSETAVTENLELAYAISVHKSQGSEFDRVYFILPKHKKALLSRELFYTGITRAQTHNTILVQEDISPLLSLRRPENSQLNLINSSLFWFRPTPPELQNMHDWYEEGKIHKSLANIMMRSKSEVIIANILLDRNIPFRYEIPLYAPDGTFYLPDFTITIRREEWYWEHLGMLSVPVYKKHWETKKAWYEKHSFSDRLITTTESEGFDSTAVTTMLQEKIGI